MASDRIQRRIDQLLDEADEAVTALNWDVVRDRAEAVLAFDPENPDALSYFAAAGRTQSISARTGTERRWEHARNLPRW